MTLVEGGAWAFGRIRWSDGPSRLSRAIGKTLPFHPDQIKNSILLIISSDQQIQFSPIFGICSLDGAIVDQAVTPKDNLRVACDDQVKQSFATD